MSTVPNQKTALITGANKGIGLEIARQLGEAGFHVFLGARSSERGHVAAEELRAVGTRADFLALDVSDPASIAAAVVQLTGHVAESGRGLDVLVNNAGVYEDDDASILTTAPEVIHRTLAVNTFGPLLVTRAFLPFLEKRAADGGTRVVNLSSGMGQFGEMDGSHAAYRLSKAAVNAVTVMLAAELRERHVAVNAVCPGWVRTDMGGEGAERSVEQGAETPLWLALVAPLKLTGKFFRDRSEIAW